MTDQPWRPSSRPPAELDAGPIRLLQVRPADADDVLATVLASQQHLIPFLPWATDYDPAGSGQWVTGSQAGWDAGAEFNYVLREVDGGAHVGNAGLMARVGPGALEIGYWVRHDRVRRGYATAATRALTAAAFTLPEVASVEIHVDVANTASAGVPRRLGYQLVGTRPAPVAAPAETGEQTIWVISRENAVAAGLADDLA